MKDRRAGGALLIVFCALAKHALAQGCASCYTTAAAGGPQTAHALRTGILVLLVPPVLIFAGLMFVLRRWRVADGRVDPYPATRLNTVSHPRFDEQRLKPRLGYAAWPQAEIASNSDE